MVLRQKIDGLLSLLQALNLPLEEKNTLDELNDQSLQITNCTCCFAGKARQEIAILSKEQEFSQVTNPHNNLQQCGKLILTVERTKQDRRQAKR